MISAEVVFVVSFGAFLLPTSLFEKFSFQHLKIDVCSKKLVIRAKKLISS